MSKLKSLLIEAITVNLTKISKDVVRASPGGPGGAYGVTHFMKFLSKTVGAKVQKIGPGEWLIYYRSNKSLEDSWNKKGVGDKWQVTI